MNRFTDTYIAWLDFLFTNPRLSLALAFAFVLSGRKSKWYSPFLVGVKNSEDEYESICRVMSGFSDDFYQEKFDKFSAICVDEKPSNVSTCEECFHWFDLEKSEVWEIKGADLTRSPRHKACNDRIIADIDNVDEVGQSSSSNHVGVGLRFPRFIRERNDKRIEDATTSEQVYRLFTSQFS